MNADELLQRVFEVNPSRGEGSFLKEEEKPRRVLKEETPRITIDDRGSDIRTAFRTTEGGCRYGPSVVPADFGAKKWVGDEVESELRLPRKGSTSRKIEL